MGLASRRAHLLKRGDRALLLGDAFARGLSVPLGSLAKDAGIDLDMCAVPRDDQDLSGVVVLVCAEQCPLELARSSQGARARALIWVMPASASLPHDFDASIQPFMSGGLELPLDPNGIHPVASGYAQWAGALWQWIT
jgi:hypothetical protein